MQVDKIHSLPLLVAVEWTFIYLPIIFHTVYGIYLGVAGRPNVGQYNYGKNWAYFSSASAPPSCLLYPVPRAEHEGPVRRSADVRARKPRHAEHDQPHQSPLVGHLAGLSDRPARRHISPRHGLWTGAITWA
jgi:hypothetical protein